jgi:hypothetical protein
MHRSLKFLGVSALAAGIAACGGGSSGSSTGTVNVGLTDAPVDNAVEVNVEVEALVLQHSGGERSRYEFDMAQPVNLLELTGGTVMTLLDDEEVEAGEYNWMRLELGNGNTIKLEADGGEYPLTTPSARGVQTSGFTVPAGGEINLTIDFDVRKSIVNPQNDPNSYKLKPVIRLVDNAEVGTIAGTVAGERITNQCSDADASDPNSYNGSVYVHEGDVVPDDIGSANEPLVAVPVTNDSGQYEYTAAFIPTGNYTVSYTCGEDKIETAEGQPSDDNLTFVGVTTVDVQQGQTATVNF